jgi:hypothetical protein
MVKPFGMKLGDTSPYEVLFRASARQAYFSSFAAAASPMS